MKRDFSYSVFLSQLCICIFAVILAAADCGAWWLCRWFVEMSGVLDGTMDTVIFAITIYLCSVFAWVALFCLWRLLKKISKGKVFIPENVRYMRVTCWCCVGVFAVCLICSALYIPMAIISIAAGFMALIVHIVKNSFEQAISMKDELDLTV